MNERIKELAEQANINIDSFQFSGTPIKHIVDEPSLEKFAELIVRECVAQIEIEKGNPYRNMGDQNGYGIGACVESIRRIREHFGVE